MRQVPRTGEGGRHSANCYARPRAQPCPSLRYLWAVMMPTPINLTRVAEDVESRLGKLTPVGRRAVLAFQGLPGLKRWQLPPVDQAWFPEAMRAFEYGLPLALLGELPSFRPLQRRIAAHLADGKRPAKSDWAEVQAAALFSHFGAAIEFIPRGAMRTPDMRATLGGEAVEIEVTAAEQKPSHANLQQVLSDFVQVVQPSDFDWNLIASFADAENRRVVEAALNSVLALHEGERASEHGAWEVHAVPQDRRGAVVGGAEIEALSPLWWPGNGPTFFCVSTLFGHVIPRSIRVQSLVSEVSYMNPLRAKADRPQW